MLNIGILKKYIISQYFRIFPKKELYCFEFDKKDADLDALTTGFSTMLKDAGFSQEEINNSILRTIKL